MPRVVVVVVADAIRFDSIRFDARVVACKWLNPTVPHGPTARPTDRPRDVDA